MNHLQVLSEIGLSDGESKVYLALLKLGPITVHEIKEETSLHRTTIYDFLEKLLNKGLANFVIKNNVKNYSAAHPTKILEFIKEKEDKVKEILPDLSKIADFKKEDIKVEVFRGIEAIKNVLNDVLRVGKDHVILGVDEAMYKEKLGPFMEQYFEKEKKKGFRERILTSTDATFVYDKTNAFYRFVPKEYFNPTPTYIYGDYVAILIWEPLSVIKIFNPSLADSYKKYFELLWNIAEDWPRSKWPTGKKKS